MHEMAIVQSIMDVVDQQAKMYGAQRVTKINLEFGLLTGVQPDAVRFAFEVLSKDGVAEGAELNITIIPLKAYCMDCSTEHVMERYEPFCPSCESAALQFLEGRDEMKISSIEIEDPPPSGVADENPP